MSAVDWSVIFYFGSIFLLIIFAVLFSYFDRVFTVFIACILFFFSGFREGGFDYEEYLVMIRLGLESHNTSLLDAALFAKDPLFGVFTYIFSFFSSDAAFILSVMIFFAVLTKMFFAFSMPGRSSLFLGVYAIFLAPGLEFAAVRTALGLGLFLLAIQFWSTRKYKIIFLVLAGLSHVSVWVSVAAAYFQRKVAKKINFPVLLGVIIVSFLAAESVQLWAPIRSEDYLGNLGTSNAVIVSLFCLFLLMISFSKRALVSSQANYNFSNVALYNISVVLTAIAVGAASPQVTLSARILEISWCIALVLFFRVWWFKRKFPQFWIGLLVFLVFLCVVNISRETWAAFFWLNIVNYSN